MVTIVKYFIWTERLSDFKLYTESVALILPYFAAAGRGQYNAKASRFTLEQVLKYDDKAKALFYSSGHRTVRYSCHQLGGIWTDLSIDQTLINKCKSSRGLTGGYEMKPPIKNDLDSFVKVYALFAKKAFDETDSEKLVSFVSGVTSSDGLVNCHEARTVGLKIQAL